MYIHYGAEAFDLGKFKKVSNRNYFSKPYGGLWASPIDAEEGWKTWCENENFKPHSGFDKHFCFELAKDAKVYHIRKADDIYELPLLAYSMVVSTICIDFEEASKSWDAIEVHISEDTATEYTNSIYWLLYGWDCDSILIMNPDIIKEVKE